MFAFIIRRIIQAIPTFFGITLLSWMIMELAPGNPVAILSFSPSTTPSQRAALAERLGTNDPWYEQYFRWLVGDDFRTFEQVDRFGRPIYDEAGDPVLEKGSRRGILRADFGTSFTSNKPVLDVLGEKIWATLELGISALLVGFGIGVPIGILAAVYQGGTFDNVTRILSVVFNSVPVFWLGLLVILIFGAQLNLLPMGGRRPMTMQAALNPVPIYDRLEYLILPVFVLATGFIAVFSRFMRASTLDILNQDYIRTAHAKGLSRGTVWFQHATRNALIPIATLLGPAIPNVIGGALITETVFSWPGIGRAAYEAVLQQDYPIVMATVILAALTTIAGYLLSDIMYAIIDPRIRLN